ncbi:LuxR C-terminal-related transcriptional regulator [Streptomyces sp. RB6PN25]|uniref:LuxR C-terminal-related transcriptional regulator n=1 Tax=Streptomyces humicola TaxID=2953240 RepID=A0ABT1PTA7_9ACTN|nr:LuxR C-terminal-related transcriptional regulator [Streptomyces humicola]MCQ4080909.1 LuxR C-terminal-related transcriptional regulator [Streptomyces humicola]
MHGSGKSRLLRHVAAEAEKSGIPTIAMRGAASGDLRMAEGAAVSFPAATRQWREAGLITVDDMHAVTSGSGMDFLQEILQFSGGVCVGSLRSGVVNVELDQSLALNDEVVRIPLNPLASSAVTAMAAALLDADLDSGLLALCGQAGGNPLLVSELLSGLREESALAISQRLARLSSERIPRRIHDVAKRWLAELSGEARHLVQVAAALGSSFSVGDIARMQRGTTAQLLPALNEALDSGVLVCAGTRTVFQHELIRRAVAQSIPVSVRETLQREAASVRGLAAVPDPGSAVAAGGGPQDPAPFPAPVSRLIPAVFLARSSLPRPLAPELADELFGVAVRSLERTKLPQARIPEVARRILDLFADDEHRARSRARVILAEAERSSDADSFAALAVLSNLEWAAGNLAEGLRWGWEAVHGISGAVPVEWRPYPRLALAAKLADAAEFDEAEHQLALAREDIARLGLTQHAAAPAVVRARILLQAGRLAEAREEAAAGVDLASQQHSRWVMPFGRVVYGMVALRMGDVRAAADQVWRCRAEATAHETVFRSARFAWAEFQVSAAQLGYQRAAKLLATEHADLLSQRSLFIEEAGAAAELVRTALAAADVSLATTVTAVADELAEANPAFPTLAVSAAHARGLLTQDADALRRVAEEHRDPWAAALAKEDLARVLGAHSSDRSETAARGLRAALQRFEEIGATADASRVRRELERDDVGAPGLRRDRVAIDGWQSLSDAERRVARLAGEGLTNRQIARRVSISPHTVNYHLRGVFRKLGIASRVELARYLTDGA